MLDKLLQTQVNWKKLNKIIFFSESLKFQKIFFILIKYKLYIYDILSLTIDPTIKPWTNNFFNLMINPGFLKH